jgi:hypothetical protein
MLVEEMVFVAKGLMNAGWDTVVVEPGASGAREMQKKEAYLMLFVQPPTPRKV